MYNTYPKMDTHQKNTIYVRNLNEKIKQEELKKSLNAIFSQFGTILDIVVSKTAKMQGQAFIVFKELESSINACKSMQGFTVFDKPMRIDYAKSDSDAILKEKSTYHERPKKNRPSPPRNEEVPKKKNRPPPPRNNVVPKKKKKEANRIPGGPTPEEPLNHILFLTNLPDETNNMMLSLLFKQYAGFKEVRMVPNRHDIAFVEYETGFQAGTAKDALQGFKITPAHATKISFAKK